MPISLALFFASLALLVLGVNIFIHANYFNLDVFFHFLEVALTGSIVFGVIGYFMGRIIETSHISKNKKANQHSLKNNELLIDDLLVYDIGIEKKEEKKESDKSN